MLLLFALGLSACKQPPVQILLDGFSVYEAPLGGDRLVAENELGVAPTYPDPPYSAELLVNSPITNDELLAFPFDVDPIFESVSHQSCHIVWPPVPSPLVCEFGEPEVPEATAVGVIHVGGEGNQSYPIGSLLSSFNGGTPEAIHGLYMRLHGECETTVPWSDLLDAILSQVNDTSGEQCSGIGNTELWCPDYDETFRRRVASSYLRRAGVSGRGGFGLYVEGDVTFDSLLLDDLSFAGKAGYDVSLDAETGLPAFSVSAGPFKRTWNCSYSPLAACKISEVEDSVVEELTTAAVTLTQTIGECLQVPLSFPLFGGSTCTKDSECSSGGTARYLADHARKGALARGANVTRADQFSNALTNKENWSCAPVTETCAAIARAAPTEENVCQLHLRAQDLVPMPDSLSLVWYRGGTGSSQPTAAEALYLALSDMAADDRSPVLSQLGKEHLAELCSQPWPDGVTARAFVKRVR